MPWTYLLVESITLLGKSEEWFWNSEPRIVINLIREKKRIERINQKNLACYISCCVWGKDPNELDGLDKIKKDDKIPGRDKPIDENLLRGLW